MQETAARGDRANQKRQNTIDVKSINKPHNKDQARDRSFLKIPAIAPAAPQPYK